MGSTDSAIITGFICRLCSKINTIVFHIFGEEGERRELAKKINAYLPIDINVSDPLPKTICMSCILQLEVQHKIVEHFKKARQGFTKVRAIKRRRCANRPVLPNCNHA